MTDDPSSTPRPVLNPDALARLRNLGGAPLLVRVMSAFVVEASERATACRQAFFAHDANALAAAMHGHASAAAWLGADHLLACVRLGERQARDADWVGVARSIDEVERAMAAAVSEARRHLHLLAMEEG